MLRKHNKIFMIILLVALCGFAFLPLPAFAQVTVRLSCGLWAGAPAGLSGSLLDCVTIGLYNVVVILSQVFVIMAKIVRAILSFPNVAPLQSSPIVTIGWPIVRDICNMFFIVALMIMAFGTIFRIQKQQASSHLLTLIIFAGLINFSLLLVKLMIDASNVFVNAFLPGIDKLDVLATFLSASGLVGGFSFDPVTGDFTVSTATTTPELWISIALAGVVAVFGIGQLWKIIWVLLKRIIIFWGTMAMSPILFIAPLLPGTQRLMGDWWKYFTEALVSGPATVFFLYLVMHAIGPSGIGPFATQIKKLLELIIKAPGTL